MKPDSKQGMTLVEILMVVGILAVLAAVLIPVTRIALRSRENARAASKLRTAVLAFTSYRSEMGSYPADRTPGVIPPEMAGYFAEMNIDDWWTSPTELGGYWDWDNGYNFKYSVSIAAPTKSVEQMTDFDRLVDDGDLSTGTFRKVGVQHHYIIEK
ncbi:MAG: type II secretion system GspH family protein [Pontiellaceae bacterium]|jgi:prepilin-type N-terminal cleavage/methylation domain-containing protein|nr:type II secretion system GspH family protein [Pontiellaceae bacterium]